MNDHPAFEAAEYENGAITYPPHPVGPDGAKRVGTVDLREYDARVVTWTTSTATPPGVRSPNALVIVEFEMGGEYDGPPVRAIGQVAEKAIGGDGDPDGDEDEPTEPYEVAVGDAVEPVYVAELRDPEKGIRDPGSQAWDGFRFRPVE